MPTDKSSKRSWKQGDSGSSRKRSRGWRRESGATTRRTNENSRANKLLRASLALLVTIGAIIGLFLWLAPPRPACVVMIGAGYPANLAVPPNASGLAALDDLAALSAQTVGFPLFRTTALRLKADPIRLSPDRAWSDDLGRLREAIDAKFREPTLMVYVAMHGVSTPNGPALVPDVSLIGLSDAGQALTTSSQLFPVAELIKVLGADALRAKNKVLVLDATVPTQAMALGLVHNDFARQLASLADELAKVPNLWVLSASGPDERSWESEEDHRTAFGRFVAEGLAGAAAGRDGRVSLAELDAFVREKVAGWAREHRGAIQKPVLLSTDEETLKRADKVEIAVVNRAGPVVLPKRVVRPALAARVDGAWRAMTTLQSRQPSPAATAPDDWRRYRALVARYDRLARDAWPADKIDAIETELATLGPRIERSRLIELGSSWRLSLALPGVGRAAYPRGAAAPASFSELWEEKDEKALQDRIRALATDEERMRFLSFAFARLTDTPRTVDLARVARIIRLLALAPRPAEAEFLLMLEKNLPPDTPSDLIRQALKVKVRAERAALALSEKAESSTRPDSLRPWIADAVSAADVSRRKGEDLMFATVPAADGETAAQALTKAEKGLADVEARAEAIAVAFETRDRALADLPALTRYAASRVSVAAPDAITGDAARVAALETLWGQVHDLVALLEAPSPGTDPSATAQAVREGLDKVEAEFRADVLRAMNRPADLPPDWQASYALDVPFTAADGKPRADLGPKSAAVKPAQDLDSLAAGWARGRAIAGARLALAMLGRRALDGDPVTNPAREGDLQWSDLENRLSNLDTDARSSDADDWRATLSLVGGQLARRWGRMPGTIVTLVREGPGRVEADRARGDLRAADHLTRLLDPGVSRPASGLGATQALRARLRFDLMLDLAQRAWTDHWAAEDPAAEPYWRVAGNRMLEDASRLSTDARALDPVRQRLARPGTLSIVANDPKRQALTSERELELDFRIEPTDNAAVPDGEVALGARPGPGLALGAGATPESRVVRSFRNNPEPGQKPAEVAFQVRSPELIEAERQWPAPPSVSASTLTIDGFFRGQPIRLESPIDLYRAPDVIESSHRAPIGASVAVRADKDVIRLFGAGTGALAVVLDCSGSMAAPGQAGQPVIRADAKYAQAINALGKVLETIPTGTKVSLWVFSQRALRGEDFTALNASDSIRNAVPMKAWDPAQLATVKQTIQGLVPWNKTPLFDAIVKAKADLDATETSGFKTLIVLTDGGDSEFQRNLYIDAPQGPAQLAQEVGRQDALRAEFARLFQSSDIKVNIVCFKAGADATDGKPSYEEQRTRRQFEIVKDLPVRGNLLFSRSVEDLLEQLAQAFRRSLRYRVEDLDRGRPAGSDRDSEDPIVTAEGTTDVWFQPTLRPGTYRLVIDSTRPRIEKEFTLNDGDRLLLKLVSTPRGIELVRAPVARDDFGLRKRVEAAGWDLAAIHDQVSESGTGPGRVDREIMLTLEKLFDPTERTLAQVRAADLWIEARPVVGEAGGAPAAGAGPSMGLAWTPRSAFPAPVFAVEIPGWPIDPDGVPRGASVQAWWSLDPAPAAATLERGADFDNPLQIIGLRREGVGGDAVTIESVSFERHAVRDAPGETPADRPCLVVRLKHAPGKPVRIRLGGIEPDHSEHRHYNNAGRTTVLFWNVAEDSVRDDLKRIELISLDAFRADATARGFTATLPDLASRRDTAVRAPAPVKLPPPP